MLPVNSIALDEGNTRIGIRIHLATILDSFHNLSSLLARVVEHVALQDIETRSFTALVSDLRAEKRSSLQAHLESWLGEE